MAKWVGALVLGAEVSANSVALVANVGPRVAGMLVLAGILVTFVVLGTVKWRR